MYSHWKAESGEGNFSMKKRTLTYTTRSTLSILILLGVLVIINGVSQHKFVRWDLTEYKQYTISEATKKILRALDDIVTIKLYFSKNLPPVMMLKEQQVLDLLDEYRAFAKGKIEVKREDPASSPELENQVRSMGIPQVQMTFREKDAVEVKNGYLGMGVFFGTNKEVLPIVQNVDNLEYDLTSAVKKVTSPEVLKVGYLTGHDERDLSKDYSLIQGALAQQYQIIPVTITAGQPIPSEIKTLIIAGPKKDIPEAELFEIDQYLMKGGKLIVLMDMISINMEMGLMATPVQCSLTKLLESYGIRVNLDLVLDRYNERLTYSESPNNIVQYITTVNYPFFVKVMKKNFDTKSPVLRGLETVTLPWTSSIDLLSYKLKNADISKLLQSSEFAWTQKGRFMLNPKQQFTVPPDQEKQYLLAAIVTDAFDSYYKGKEVPKAAQEPDQDTAAKGKPAAQEVHKVIEKSPKTEIMVVGNSSFITADSLRRFSGNGVFFLNSVDWLTQGEALIGIRTREVTERPLNELSDKTVAFLKFINIFGVSAIMVGVGFFIFYWRRREKKLYETMISR